MSHEASPGSFRAWRGGFNGVPFNALRYAILCTMKPGPWEKASWHSFLVSVTLLKGPGHSYVLHWSWLAGDDTLSLVKLYCSRPLPALAGSGLGRCSMQYAP